MSQRSPVFTQICIVVHDAEQASENWAKVLGVPQAPAELWTTEQLRHYTNGEYTEYSGCKVAKYELEHLVLELMQPSADPSPWRAFLDKHGQGVFHFCLFVNDRKTMYHNLNEIGAPLPYHIGYFAQGSYSYVDTKDQLGLELSINQLADNREWLDLLAQGKAQPLDEVK